MFELLKQRYRRWKWQRIPITQRLRIVMEQERIENLPENRQAKWEVFCKAHEADTVLDAVQVLWSASKVACREYCIFRGWNPEGLASEVFGPNPKECPGWFRV